MTHTDTSTTNPQHPEESEVFTVQDKRIEGYQVILLDEYRAPSKGGNTGVLHAHQIRIDGQKYSFVAMGSRQWVYKSDLVSFSYRKKGKYLDIDKATLRTVDRHGRVIPRGDRSFTQKRRSAPPKFPRE